jgi:hypothetical protein
MVDTDLGKKSMPAWLWYILKPIRFLLLKHADEGETMWMVTILECYDDPPSFLDNDAIDSLVSIAIDDAAAVRVYVVFHVKSVMIFQLPPMCYVLPSVSAMVFTWQIQARSSSV